MKIKKSREIIFETREIKRIHITRQLNEPPFVAPPEIKNETFLNEKPVRLKTRWREKLREFWKQNRRRLKNKIQKSKVLRQKTREDK
jgi:hypothetical protein